MSSNDLTTAELKQLISSIVYFQLGARTKELKTIKIKLILPRDTHIELSWDGKAQQEGHG